MVLRIGGLVVVAALATGCGDPVEGSWESESEVACGNGSVEHASVVIEDDGTGFGDVCSCTFDFIWTRLNDLKYRFNVDFEEGLDCGVLRDGEYDCDLKKEDSLRCDNAFIGDYYKID
jgi:hypothetical protein